jgi:hypothetical protein
MIKGVYVTLKLISGEEIVAAVTDETEYDITVMLPMLVKTYIKTALGGQSEAVTLGPYSHFAADDVFTFYKAQTIFIKEVEPNYIGYYEDAVDQHLGTLTEKAPEASADEIQQLVDKINKLHGSDLETKATIETIEDELDYLDNLNLTDKKILH